MGKLLNLNDDAINKSMINGLKEAFGKELKPELMEVAEREIDIIVETMCKRLELKLSDSQTFDTLDRKIRVECLIKKEV